MENTLPGDQYELMRKALDGFTDDIIRYQETEDSDVGPDVISYIEAMRRGSSDKHRRGVRHQALLNVISPFFKRRS